MDPTKTDPASVSYGFRERNRLGARDLHNGITEPLLYTLGRSAIGIPQNGWLSPEQNATW